MKAMGASSRPGRFTPVSKEQGAKWASEPARAFRKGEKSLLQLAVEVTATPYID